MAKTESNLKKTRDILQELNDQNARFNQGLKEANTYTQKMTANMATTVQKAMQLEKANALTKQGMGQVADLSKKISQGEIDQVKSARMQSDLKKKLEVATKSGNKKMQKSLNLQLKMLQSMDDAVETQEEINNLKDIGNQLDGAIGGIGGKIKGFLLNPLSGALALLMTFNATQENIADEFGAIGVTRFRTELAGAQESFKRLNLDSKEALSSIKTLGTEFGISFKDSIALADSVGDLAVSMGMTTGESAKLVGLFTEIGGLSGDTAVELAKQAESLAEAEGVAPGVVLKDIAQNSEVFAKFSGVGAKGIARAAIQARKLGIELSDVAQSMDSMLNFQDSLNAEINASIMLGRNVNLQKARELALAGNIEGFQTEILKQIGSQAEFDKMNLLQKKALADATGMSVDKLAKMVSKEKEAATLSGKLANQKIDKLVPEETITKTAELIASLQAMGMTLAETLGPTLNSVVGAFVSLVQGMEATVGVGPALIGMYAGLAMAKKKDTILTIRNAVAKYFLGAAKGSAKTAGFGAIALTAIAAGAVATMFAMMAGLQTGTPLGGVKEGSIEALHPGETVLNAEDTKMLERQQLAISGMMTGGKSTAAPVMVDTSRLERQQKETNNNLKRLITAIENTAKSTGKAVEKGIRNVV